MAEKEDLLLKFDEVVRRLDDIEEFDTRPFNEHDHAPMLVTFEEDVSDEFPPSEIATIAAEGGRPKADRLQFTWREAECHGMLHKGSIVSLYSSGTYATKCTLLDRSHHRKYGNEVRFYLKDPATGADVGTICSWQGNFSPHEEKTYRTGGSSQLVKENYENIKAGKIEIWRHWKCWKRN